MTKQDIKNKANEILKELKELYFRIDILKDDAQEEANKLCDSELNEENTEQTAFESIADNLDDAKNRIQEAQEDLENIQTI